ncbi:MAG: serine hydroxymethyltransferase [Phycisphaerae bacterium]|nr:serine hydroxymethyltransferase [Phycisphaerae bacterium]
MEVADPQVWEALQRERRRQQHTIELIASENHVSAAVMEATGSIFTNKYAEGYPRHRHYGGCDYMDQIEDLARERARELFHAEHVNVQPHCGSSANMAVYMACLKPGDTIMAMDLAQGGHLTHGSRASFSGKLYRIVSYGVDPKTEQLDMAEIRRIAREHNPDLIVTGASVYSRTIDFEAFAEIAEEFDALLMADIAHIAGLVAADLHPSPIKWCDFVTTTTHKTLRGPRSGMIMCKKQWASAVDKTVFPGIQGGPLMHVIAAKAVAFGEALRPDFRAYQQNILTNAQAMCEALRSHGFRMVGGGTDNHLMLVDLRSNHPAVTGRHAEVWLERAGIIINRNMIPFDERKQSETSGIRLGTPATTTRGMGPSEMATIAGWINDILSAHGNPIAIEQVHQQVVALCDQFPLPH